MGFDRRDEGRTLTDTIPSLLDVLVDALIVPWRCALVEVWNILICARPCDRLLLCRGDKVARFNRRGLHSDRRIVEDKCDGKDQQDSRDSQCQSNECGSDSGSLICQGSPSVEWVFFD